MFAAMAANAFFFGYEPANIEAQVRSARGGEGDIRAVKPSSH
jgi:hypothetical protein